MKSIGLRPLKMFFGRMCERIMQRAVAAVTVRYEIQPEA